MIKVLLPDEKFVPITKITDTLFRVCFDKVPNGDTGYSFFYIKDFKHNPSNAEMEACLSVIRKECDEKAERGFIEDETAESRVLIETSKDARDYLNSITSFPATDVRVGKNESGISVKRNFASQEDFDTFHNSVKAYVGGCMNEMNERVDAVQEKINNGEYEYHAPTPTSIYFDKRTQTAKVGDEFELTALFMPEGAYAELNWYTNNDKVQLTKITDVKYKVKALSAGTSQVFAKGIGTVFAALCDVTITD